MTDNALDALAREQLQQLERHTPELRRDCIVISAAEARAVIARYGELTLKNWVLYRSEPADSLGEVRP